MENNHTEKLGNTVLIASKTSGASHIPELAIHIPSLHCFPLSCLHLLGLHTAPSFSRALSKIQLHEATRHLAYGYNKAGERAKPYYRQMLLLLLQLHAQESH